MRVVGDIKTKTFTRIKDLDDGDVFTFLDEGHPYLVIENGGYYVDLEEGTLIDVDEREEARPVRILNTHLIIED